jgi:hypothetical protein
MAAAPFRAGQALGFLTGGVSSVATFQNNAAANWYAHSFIAPSDAARTLSAVRAYVSAVAGTVNASDITCDLYDSTGTGGAPGSTVETGKTTGAISAAGWYDWTGFTSALTSGQMYWAVLKNANGTPASNNVTFRTVTSLNIPWLQGTAANRFMWTKGTSTNSGGAWTLGTTSMGSLRVAYSDGSYDGIALSNAVVGGVGDGVYSARESGVKFTSPPNGVLKVSGIAMAVAAKTGSPTGNIRFGLWTGSSSPANQGYTASIPATALSGQSWLYSYFSSAITIQPGTVCRVTLAETTQSDASTSRFNNWEITTDSDSNSLALLPFEGTAAKTYFDGSSTWTDTTTSLFGFALLLATSGEFDVSAPVIAPRRFVTVRPPSPRRVSPAVISGGGGGTTTVYVPISQPKRVVVRPLYVVRRSKQVPAFAAGAAPLPAPSRRVHVRVSYPRLVARFVPLPAAGPDILPASVKRLIVRQFYPHRRLIFIPAPIGPGSLVLSPARRMQTRQYYPSLRARFVPLPTAGPNPVIMPPRRVPIRTLYAVRRTPCPALFQPIIQTVLVRHHNTVR